MLPLFVLGILGDGVADSSRPNRQERHLQERHLIVVRIRKEEANAKDAVNRFRKLMRAGPGDDLIDVARTDLWR